jgi:hypothetical protein
MVIFVETTVIPLWQCPQQEANSEYHQLKPNPISSPSGTLSLFPFSLVSSSPIPDSALLANQPQPHLPSILKNHHQYFSQPCLAFPQNSSTLLIFPSSTSSLIDFVNLLLHWITSV